MSIKLQQWAARYCGFSYLLKADDDVFVNPKRLLDVLQSETTPKNGLYMGHLHHNPFVLRSGKWRVSNEEYSGTHYPDFCSGAGFVMSYDVVKSVVPLFDVIKPYSYCAFVTDVTVPFLGQELKPVASAKDLGIILDSNLNFNDHVTSLSSSLLSTLCQVNRVRHLFSREVFNTILNSLVFSKLFYCSTVWSGTS